METPKKALGTKQNVMVNCESFAEPKSYRSVAAAFTALGLPMKSHIKFRTALKAETAKDFEHDGVLYHFAIVETEKK